MVIQCHSASVSERMPFVAILCHRYRKRYPPHKRSAPTANTGIKNHTHDIGSAGNLMRLGRIASLNSLFSLISLKKLIVFRFNPALQAFSPSRLGIECKHSLLSACRRFRFSTPSVNRKTKVFRFNPTAWAFPPPCKREATRNLSPLLRSSVPLSRSNRKTKSFPFSVLRFPFSTLNSQLSTHRAEQDTYPPCGASASRCEGFCPSGRRGARLREQ